MAKTKKGKHRGKKGKHHGGKKTKHRGKKWTAAQKRANKKWRAHHRLEVEHQARYEKRSGSAKKARKKAAFIHRMTAAFRAHPAKLRKLKGGLQKWWMHKLGWKKIPKGKKRGRK